MSTLPWRFAIRFGLCAAVAWLAWRRYGPTALALTAPLFGIALARPLLELASAARDALRGRVWRELEGRHYVFRGIPVQVIEDERHGRWVRAADVRRIVGFTASDGALALSYPSGWRRFGRPPQPHFSDAALIAHLAKETGPDALRLRHWVEREIAFPGQRRRERLGIGAEPDPETDPDSDLSRER